MNPAVLRLALRGSRHSWGRLAGIVAGIAVGVTLFLLLLGASGALQARDSRSGWLNPTGEYGSSLSDTTMLVAATTDRHAGATINRLDVAATPNSQVAIPGIQGVPVVGGFYASPALVDRIASVPADELGDRYGTLIGTLPDRVLKSPDSLVVVAGRSQADLEARYDTRMVSEFSARLFGGSSNYQTVAIIGAIAVLFPVLLLVSIVTGLGAAERRERFATLRLIGASPRTVTVIAAVETAATSLVGALLGVVLAFLFRPLAASLSIDGGTFFLDDLAVEPGMIAVTVALMVGASTLVAARRVARADIGPLGATRQQNEKTPTAWRLLPLVLGLGVMMGTSLTARFTTFPLRADLLLIASFVLLALGLVIAGPYLTLIASRVMARRASSAAGVIAANRILNAPGATFRSVSGLVIAVFMVSVFAGAATTAVQDSVLTEGPGLLPAGTVVAHGIVEPAAEFDPAELERISGVTAVSVLYSTDESAVLSARDAALLGFTDIPDTPFVEFAGDLRADDRDQRSISPSTIASVNGLQISAVLAHTDGSVAAVERARTWLDGSGVSNIGPTAPGTRADAADTAQLTMVNSFATLAYLGVGIATVIAGVSLAVATVAAVLDRRRTLGLLRLVGMPVSNVRRIMLFEAAVPLLAVVALSVALGLVVAWLVLTGLTSGRRTLGWPDPGYYLALGSSLLLALGAVAASFRTIRRSTATASTRFE
ncbi:FtsX-like permease family protein [Salinibacterium sp. ZJ454]|uniref:FtsX-like permease family protein n=1 Tax=Salinibacterium sp. ZJ454 TaxID=2708339 RepID=UPI00141E52E6|nr:FtsX-like permease family protein [Salinibacterium sp. ZJ454]